MSDRPRYEMTSCVFFRRGRHQVHALVKLSAALICNFCVADAAGALAAFVPSRPPIAEAARP